MEYVRVAHRTVYENPWLRFEAHEIVHPNGAPGEHGLVLPPPASAVVVYDAGDVFFTRQARFAVDTVVIEIVKGGREPGESALEAARRETREEVGFIAQRWDALGQTYELPSIVAHPVDLFLARDLMAVQTALEEIESIEVSRMPFARALDMATTGGIDDAVTGIALLRAAHILRRDGECP